MNNKPKIEGKRDNNKRAKEEVKFEECETNVLLLIRLHFHGHFSVSYSIESFYFIDFCGAKGRKSMIDDFDVINKFRRVNVTASIALRLSFFSFCCAIIRWQTFRFVVAIEKRWKTA